MAGGMVGGAYAGYLMMTTVTSMLFPPATLFCGGIDLGAVIGGWLARNLGNCNPIQEFIVGLTGGFAP
jgi:hypothetical protein